jgi:hypothetical protein
MFTWMLDTSNGIFMPALSLNFVTSMKVFASPKDLSNPEASRLLRIRWDARTLFAEVSTTMSASKPRFASRTLDRYFALL